jgi:hypothetical protein
MSSVCSLIQGPGYFSMYSDLLRAGRFGVRTSVGQEIFCSSHPFRQALGPILLCIGYRVPFQGVKQLGCSFDQPPAHPAPSLSIRRAIPRIPPLCLRWHIRVWPLPLYLYGRWYVNFLITANGQYVMPDYVFLDFITYPAVRCSGYGQKSVLYEVYWHVDETGCHTEFLLWFNPFKLTFISPFLTPYQTAKCIHPSPK